MRGSQGLQHTRTSDIESPYSAQHCTEQNCKKARILERETMTRTSSHLSYYDRCWYSFGFHLYNSFIKTRNLRFLCFISEIEADKVPCSHVGHEPEEPNSADLLSVRGWAGRVQQNCSDTAPVPGTAWGLRRRPGVNEPSSDTKQSRDSQLAISRA